MIIEKLHALGHLNITDVQYTYISCLNTSHTDIFFPHISLFALVVAAVVARTRWHSGPGNRISDDRRSVFTEHGAIQDVRPQFVSTKS